MSVVLGSAQLTVFPCVPSCYKPERHKQGHCLSTFSPPCPSASPRSAAVTTLALSAQSLHHKHSGRGPKGPGPGHVNITKRIPQELGNLHLFYLPSLEEVKKLDTQQRNNQEMLIMQRCAMRQTYASGKHKSRRECTDQKQYRDSFLLEA